MLRKISQILAIPLTLCICNGMALPDTISDQSTYYLNPGIIAFRDGRWIGSDHLYNLTNNIDVVVEFFTPTNVVLPLNKDEVKQTITGIFQKARLNVQPDAAEGKPPLPFFHMLIMAYPLDKGYVVYCEGRLFEQVQLDRVTLDEQTAMQAITWESQNLIISSKEDLKDQVMKSITEIATAFADRYRFYEDIRIQIQRKEK
jgi:hypothetical protein